MAIELLLEKQHPLPIKSPRSFNKTRQQQEGSSYSLFFDSMSPSRDWIQPYRKHSVSIDGSDEDYSTNTDRRASLPNNHFSMPTLDCAICNSFFYSSLEYQSCDHKVCRKCIHPITLACPLCLNKNMFCSLPKALDFFNCKQANNSSKLSSSPLIYPEREEEEAFYIGDLLSPTATESIHNTTLYCVKLSNIPWDVSQQDIKLFLKNVELPSLAQSIHIMMDRTTGKTLSDCYVEFTMYKEALKAVQYSGKLIKKRIITVTFCSINELLQMTFPTYEPGFPLTKLTSFSFFITQDEINSLLNICKNYKVHFSRKCAERPFENIITITKKYPWEFISTLKEKSQLFDLLKQSIEVLKVHLAKTMIHMDKTLLERLVRAGMVCPIFTEEQKSILLETADFINCCPADIKSFISLEKDSFVHITPNIAMLQQNNHNDNNVSSLLNILNGHGSQKEEGTFLECPEEGSSSDEDSYCFCDQDSI